MLHQKLKSPEKNFNVRNFGIQQIIFQNLDMKLVCSILGRKLKNPRLIPSENFFLENTIILAGRSKISKLIQSGDLFFWSSSYNPRRQFYFLRTSKKFFGWYAYVYLEFCLFRYGNPTSERCRFTIFYMYDYIQCIYRSFSKFLVFIHKKSAQ